MAAEALGHLNATSVAKEDTLQETAVDDAEAETETVVEADEDDIPDPIPEVTQDADHILRVVHVQEIVIHDQEATQETANPTQEIVATIAAHDETKTAVDHIEIVAPGPDLLYLKKYPVTVVPDQSLDHDPSQDPNQDQDPTQKYLIRIMLTRGRDHQCQLMVN